MNIKKKRNGFISVEAIIVGGIVLAAGISALTATIGPGRIATMTEKLESLNPFQSEITGEINEDSVESAVQFLISKGIVSPSVMGLNMDDYITEGEVNTMLYNAIGLMIPIIESSSAPIDPNHVGYAISGILRLEAMYHPLVSPLVLKQWVPNDSDKRGEFMKMFSKLLPVYIAEGEHTDKEIIGPVVISGENITLKNVTIQGDLIITGKVNESTTTLNNVWIEGRLILISTTFEQIEFMNYTEITREIIYVN